MKSLSKSNKEALQALQTRYDEARAALEAEIEEAQGALAKAYDGLDEKVADLNAIITEANELREQVAADIEAYMEERSDAWREGDRGSAYEEWKSAWENEVEEVGEFDRPDLDMPDCPEAGALLNDGDYPPEPGL